MGFEGCVDCKGEVSMEVDSGSEKEQTAKMTCDVISFGTSGATVLPLAGETQIVGAFPADVYVAKVVVQGLWVREGLGALQPETDVLGRGGDCGSHIVGQRRHSRVAVKYSCQETIESQDKAKTTWQYSLADYIYY